MATFKFLAPFQVTSITTNYVGAKALVVGQCALVPVDGTDVDNQIVYRYLLNNLDSTNQIAWGLKKHGAAAPTFTCSASGALADTDDKILPAGSSLIIDVHSSLDLYVTPSANGTLFQASSWKINGF